MKTIGPVRLKFWAGMRSAGHRHRDLLDRPLCRRPRRATLIAWC